MRDDIRRWFIRVLNAKYSVSSWLWIIVSTITAVIMLLQLLENSPGAKEFLDALPFNGIVWSAGLIVTGVTKMYGMARAKRNAVAWGSLVAFVLWLFGAVTFIQTGESFTVILLILPIMLFNAYLFLGETLRDRNQI